MSPYYHRPGPPFYYGRPPYPPFYNQGPLIGGFFGGLTGSLLGPFFYGRPPFY
ncbi:hypothetical protein [Domibacillus antri]|uniref:hypothetical protein n=1 Tax=Domibacillus antri TaxID=1714264 RepID=UPI000B179678|nr:hypothetical protein [Domibacillus antri]